VAAAAFAMALSSLGRATALAVSLSHETAMRPWTAIGTPAMLQSLLLTIGVAVGVHAARLAPLASLAVIVAAAVAGSAVVARELVREHRRRPG
jgi:hypothetical protein